MRAHQVDSYGRCVPTDDPSTQPTNDASAVAPTGLPEYEIRVKGHLGSRWSGWFGGLSLTAEDDGTSVLRGGVVDQAALHGLLAKLRDIGIPLISLTELPDRANHISPNHPSGATS